METNKILTADILDIVFDGRNKQYGAYDLRKTYKKRILSGLLVMIGLCVLIFISTWVFGLGKTKARMDFNTADIDLDKYKEDKKPPPPPPPPPKVEPPKLDVTKFTPPKIVKDEEVKKEDEIKEVKELENKTTSNFEQKGLETDVQQPVVNNATGNEVIKQQEDYDKLFTAVEIPSEFPGGEAAWRKYVERNVNADAPKDNGAPVGKYVVIVSFIVEKDGSITDVQGQLQSGGEDYGTVDEAVRAIKKGPKWNPGVQNGIKVRSTKRQPIVFNVADE